MSKRSENIKKRAEEWEAKGRECSLQGNREDYLYCLARAAGLREALTIGSKE